MVALSGGRRSLLAVLASGLIAGLAACSGADPVPGPARVIDLVKQDWRHTPGVAANDDGLHVSATGRSIVEQDGGGGQPNPPVNLVGPHLVTAGDFSVSASFTDVTADASLTLYDSPPVIADEFRIEPASLRLTLRGEDLHIAVFDGSRPQEVTDPRPAHDEHVSLSDPADVLSVRRSGDTLHIASGGATVTSVPLGGVFGSGQIWLGLSCDSGSFRVSSLTAAAPEGIPLDIAGPMVAGAGTAGHGAAAQGMSVAQHRVDGLQALATRVRPGFTIGAAVALGPLASDAAYARNLLGNFGAVTMENAMKAQSLSPHQGMYTFEEADAIVAIAEENGMAVHGHAIAFTEAMPRWMRDLPSGTEAERRASAEALLDYVATVVTHFKGRLDSIDVVNEPFDVDQGTGLQDNVWYRVFGPHYPAVVSQAVHDADPDVMQFINENGADVPGPRRDALLRLALDTNARGGHIDGVGLQAHVYHLETDAISADELNDTLRLFEDAGLRVRISENDVTDGQGTHAQAEQYATVLAACLRSNACVSYTTWGVDNRYNWSIDWDGDLRQGGDFLFGDGRPIPAYDAMRRVLGG